ncbi:MAG: hypothetical protein OES09_14560 [Gammaproteobacteria bacterium]|nr:hypothetical protein [Gammaproteobacteria bacterium]
MPINNALHWPFLAESGPWSHSNFGDLNDRFQETQPVELDLIGQCGHGQM